MRYVLNICLLLLLAFPAFAAEDEGLYDPPPPAGAAWVRNLTGAPLELGATSLSDEAYHMVMQGDYDLAGQPVSIKAGARYSIAPNGLVLTDPELENRARSLLVLYNLTNMPALDLMTADGKLTVVSGVAAGQVSSRMVQPVQVELAIGSDGNFLSNLDPITLQRGASYSIIASDNAGGLAVSLILNETARP